MYKYIHLINLFCSVCFILSLKGLASHKSSVKGNILGITSMAIAIAASCFHPSMHRLFFIILPIVAGGAIGIYIAYTIHINKLPELIAGFHSLIGLSASLIACSAFLNPQSLSISTNKGILAQSVLFEMSLGLI